MPSPKSTVRDDRETLEPTDRVVMIVRTIRSSHRSFSMRHMNGIQGLISASGVEALVIAGAFAPTR